MLNFLGLKNTNKCIKEFLKGERERGIGEGRREREKNVCQKCRQESMGGVGGNEEFYGRKHTLLKGVVYCMAKIQS